MSVLVRRASLAEVFALRHAVLRPGEPAEASAYAEDDRAVHVAALDDDVVVGCATFFEQAFPQPGEEGSPDAAVPDQVYGLVAWRLRGMATAEAYRSTGVGSSVLTFGLSVARGAGGELVWCNARTVALAFYERQGFVRLGSEFLSGGQVKLPHYRAWTRLHLSGPT